MSLNIRKNYQAAQRCILARERERDKFYLFRTCETQAVLPAAALPLHYRRNWLHPCDSKAHDESLPTAGTQNKATENLCLLRALRTVAAHAGVTNSGSTLAFSSSRRLVRRRDSCARIRSSSECVVVLLHRLRAPCSRRRRRRCVSPPRTSFSPRRIEDRGPRRFPRDCGADRSAARDRAALVRAISRWGHITHNRDGERSRCSRGPISFFQQCRLP